MAIWLFLILALIYFGLRKYFANGKDAPFVPLRPRIAQRVINLVKVGPKDIFYDLGSGDGRLVILAALRGAKAIGIEKNWINVLYSRLWLRL